MTTVVWDGKLLASDRLYYSEHFANESDAKIFTPQAEAFFEGSRLVAFGGAGESMYLKTFERMLLERPVTSLQEVMLQLKEDAKGAPYRKLFTSLLILTEKSCFKISLAGADTATCEDVTHSCAAIGSGAKFAFPLLPAAGVFAALFRAARCDEKTGFRVNWVSKAPGSKIELATLRQQLGGGVQDLWLLVRDKIKGSSDLADT